MCQNTTMPVNGAWIKRYCIFCSKTYNTLHSCHNFPVGSWQAARGACICETSIFIYQTPYLPVIFLSLIPSHLRHTTLPLIPSHPRHTPLSLIPSHPRHTTLLSIPSRLRHTTLSLIPCHMRHTTLPLIPSHPRHTPLSLIPSHPRHTTCY